MGKLPELAKRARRWFKLVPFHIVITASTLLTAAAVSVYLGVTSWQWPWLGNIFAALLVTAISAVVIDSLQVKRKRRQLALPLSEAKQSLITAGNDLKERLDSLLELSDDCSPTPPHWHYSAVSKAYYPGAYISFLVARLRKSLTVWTIHSGYGFGQSMIPTIETKLNEFREAFYVADDAYCRLADVMSYKRPRSITLGTAEVEAPEPALEKKVRDQAAAARTALCLAKHAVSELISQLQSNADMVGISDQLSRRIPPRLPRSLRVVVGITSVTWIGVLGWSAIDPSRFPDKFFGDNVENIAADSVVSLGASGIALLILASRGAVLTSRALAPAHQINGTVLQIQGQIQNGSEGLRDYLLDAASWIEDLTDAVMSDRPSAELAIKSRLCVAEMRALAKPTEPIHHSEKQLAENLELVDLPDDDDRDRGRKAELRGHVHTAMLGHSQHPNEDLTELVLQLHDFSRTAIEVANGKR